MLPAEEAAAAARGLDAGNAVWRWADVAGIHAGHLLRQAEDYMRTWLLGSRSALRSWTTGPLWKDPCGARPMPPVCGI